MSYSEDPRVAEAKAKGMGWFLDRLQVEGLKRTGHELVGPCPRPGCGGTDRFSVDVRKGVFLCRKCEADGGAGDGIALVRLVKGLTFPEALEWICGPKQEVSEAEMAQRAADRAASEAKARAEGERRRLAAIREARAIWEAGLSAEGTPVREYLTRRGIGPANLPQMPKCLRYHPALPYMVEDGPGRYIEVHRGPAMLAAIQNGEGRFSAVHRTWLDLSQQKGKIRINRGGVPLDAKKGWGSKKGGSIRLLTPPGADVMVMGEGIETTLSPVAAGVLPDAAFWAGIDLGNMSGKRQRGPGLKFAGIPAMDDTEAFVPPPWVRRLIFIQDGDSEPRETASRMQAGLRRAMIARPGLRGQVVVCPPGADLNDVLCGVDAAEDRGDE